MRGDSLATGRDASSKSGVTVEASDRFVAVPGGEVFVRRWRPDGGTGAPIILLHDSLGSVEQWRGFPEALAAGAGRGVIAYDRLVSYLLERRRRRFHRRGAGIAWLHGRWRDL